MKSLLIVPALLLAAGSAAQQSPPTDDPTATRAALRQALFERHSAETRSRSLEQRALDSRDAADRTANQAAALAARVQQAEAGIAAAEVRASLVGRERALLREALGRQQQPVVRLTAALQQFARRPLALAVLRPGSVHDVVYLRALLANAVPQVQARTAGLRSQLARIRQLRDEARQAAQILRSEQAALRARRTELATLETRQRLASRQASGSAAREAERALALGEETRDLNDLVTELDRAGSLREQLAALPGPLLRPANPAAAIGGAAAAGPTVVAAVGAPTPYLLPVTGRTVLGFGAAGMAGISRGLTLAPRSGAQVVAPAAGRVAFAGPYRGYGRIVIIEHPGAWTSLITGLARADVAVGDEVVGGAPIGIAAQTGPSITIELRQGGQPVNPLPLVG
ncbi:MAG: peptidoglycan DD-metalloendopeptidase family protein [Croceibacterium sp.]